MLVNDICGLRKAGCGLIKGDSNDGKVKAWENHFRELFGEVPLVDECNILQKKTVLNISRTLFTEGALAGKEADQRKQSLWG